MLPFLDQSETLHRFIYTNYTLLGTIKMSWLSILLLIYDNLWFSNFLFACQYLHEQLHVVLVVFSDFNTQNVEIESLLIPLISLIPTSKDVFYPTHHVYSLGLSFYSFISLLSTLLPKLAFWTLFRAKFFYLYLTCPYHLMNYLWAILTQRIVYYNW